MSNIAIRGSVLNSPGGVVTEGEDFCKINGKPVTFVGASGTTHAGIKSTGQAYTPGSGDVMTGFPPLPPSIHLAGTWFVKEGSDFFKVGGKRVSMVGCKTTCNHLIASGEFVKIGGAKK